MILANQVTRVRVPPRHTSVFVQIFALDRELDLRVVQSEPSRRRDERSCHRTGRARRRYAKKVARASACAESEIEALMRYDGALFE
jgi:hypothetical protein